MVLEATLGCHFPILLQVLIRLSDKCSAKLQSTYLTLSNNEHNGLEVKNSKSVPGSSPILQNPRDEPGCQSFIIWNKGGVGGHLDSVLAVTFICTPGAIYTIVYNSRGTASHCWQSYLVELL